MSYKNTRPESPKGRVFSKLMHEGEQAAIAFGTELNLPMSKLKRWMIEFGAQSAGTATVPTKPNGKILVTTKGKRVCLSYDTERKGTVVKEGDEVSEVKWDDGWPQNFYSNVHLVPL